jgi:uncharacterized protein
MVTGYRKTADLPQVIPVFPLDGVLLLPGGQLPLNIFEPRYLNMIDDAMAGDRVIGMIQTAQVLGGPAGDREAPALAPTGCAGRITSLSETADGRYLITLTGLCRFETGEELPAQTPYRRLRVAFGRFADDLTELGDDESVDRAPFLLALRRYLDSRMLDLDWETAKTAPCDALIASLAMALPFDAAEKQALLEAPTLEDRRMALTALLEIDAAAGDDDEPPSLQ